MQVIVNGWKGLSSAYQASYQDIRGILTGNKNEIYTLTYLDLFIKAMWNRFKLFRLTN